MKERSYIISTTGEDVIECGKTLEITQQKMSTALKCTNTSSFLKYADIIKEAESLSDLLEKCSDIDDDEHLMTLSVHDILNRPNNQSALGTNPMSVIMNNPIVQSIVSDKTAITSILFGTFVGLTSAAICYFRKSE